MDVFFVGLLLFLGTIEIKFIEICTLRFAGLDSFWTTPRDSSSIFKMKQLANPIQLKDLTKILTNIILKPNILCSYPELLFLLCITQ